MKNGYYNMGGINTAVDNLNSVYKGEAQRTANANFQAKGLQLANTLADQSKLNRLKQGMSGIYDRYLGMSQDPNLPPEAQMAAQQYNDQLGMLGDSMDIRNVNDISKQYQTMLPNMPNVADLMNKQRLAQIRADSLKAIANGRASSQMEIMKIREGNRAQIERDKAILKYGGGLEDLSDTSSGSYDSYEPQGLDDSSFAAILDALGNTGGE